MDMLISTGMISNVARSHRVSTFNPAIAKISSCGNPLLELAAHAIPQFSYNLLSSTHLRFTVEPTHSAVLMIHTAPCHVGGMRDLPFLLLWA